MINNTPMAASTYDIDLEQGSTYSTVFTYTDSNGAAVNLTGFTARMQVRAVYAASGPSISLTTSAGGGISLGGAAGTVTVTVPAATSANLVAKNYVYDLELVSAGGVVTKLIRGKMKVLPEVTR
jgi:hypothetical protein